MCADFFKLKKVDYLQFCCLNTSTNLQPHNPVANQREKVMRKFKFFKWMLQSIKSFILEKIQSLQETRLVHFLELCSGFLANDSQKLTSTEIQVWQEFKNELSVVWPTEQQEVIVLVGLTGDGKSFIAQKLTREHKAILISSDRIRVALRKAGCTYNNVNVIVRRLLTHVLANGGSAVLDSDHVAPWKRRSLDTFLKRGDLDAQYVRVLADPQDAMRWIENGDYVDTIYDPNLVERNVRQDGRRLKMNERARHYSWHRKEDGTPRLFRFPHTEVWNSEKK